MFFYVHIKTFQEFLSMTNHKNLRVMSICILYSKKMPMFQDQCEFFQ